MTVMIGIAVVPKDGLKPYLLMGSDSKKVEGFLESDGSISYDVREDAEKIFKIGTKLVGVAGRTPPNFISDLVKFLRDNNCCLSKLCKLAIDYTKGYFESSEDLLDLTPRCTMIFGNCEKQQPEIGRVEVDFRDLSKAHSSVFKLDTFNFAPVFIGISGTNDLQKKFNNRVKNNNPNLNSIAMKRAASDYLKEAALRNLETCNQEIKFKKLT